MAGTGRPENEVLKNAVFILCGQAKDVPTSTELAKRIAGVMPPPSDRTIRRYIEQWRLLDKQARRSYQEARWPEAFGTADLPWESAAVVLELAEKGLGGRVPLIPLAVWYWRVHLTDPGATVELKLRSAKVFALKYTTPARDDLARLLLGVVG